MIEWNEWSCAEKVRPGRFDWMINLLVLGLPCDPHRRQSIIIYFTLRQLVQGNEFCDI